MTQRLQGWARPVHLWRKVYHLRLQKRKRDQWDYVVCHSEGQVKDKVCHGRQVKELDSNPDLFCLQIADYFKIVDVQSLSRV